MKQELINIYDFKELKPEIQEKILSSFREKNDYYFLNEDLNEFLKELLKENKISFEDIKLFYSLNSCQGEGVCFTGSFNWKGYQISISHNSTYYHKKSTEIYFNEIETDGDEVKRLILLQKIKEQEKKEEEFKEIYYQICDKIEKEGYSFIDYEDSEESIKNYIEINEYRFFENGEIY